MEPNAKTATDTKTPIPGIVSRNAKRSAGFLLAFGLLMAACGSDSTETATAGDDTTEVAVSSEPVAEAEDATAEDQAPPPDDAPGEGAEGQGPPPDGGEGGKGQGPPPGDTPEDADGDDTSLSDGPQNVGEHGPFSNADLDRDDTVTRAELDEFMSGALEREIGLVAFFELYDTVEDDVLDADELATVEPAFAFDGTDANEDGLVSLAEVTEYANEEGRSYRAIGLGEFFDLVDTDGDDEVSPEEIEAAHESGLLARF